jgi:hypothetical protein
VAWPVKILETTDQSIRVLPKGATLEWWHLPHLMWNRRHGWSGDRGDRNCGGAGTNRAAGPVVKATG